MQFDGIFDLRGKTALVTGASRGLGRVIALGLADFGADVALTGRTMVDLEKVALEISDRGREALPIACDVTNLRDVERLADQALSRFGKVDILVNNAGVIIRKGALDMTLDEWRRIIDINLEGTFTCCKVIGAMMVERSRGSIINISSVRGEFASPGGYSAYAPSKASGFVTGSIIYVDGGVSMGSTV